MAHYQISDPALPHLIDLWRSREVVLGPRAEAGGEVVLAELDSFAFTRPAAGSLLLSSVHTLLALLERRPPPASIVLFGVSPCDAVAVDALRSARRAAGAFPAVTIVSLACARPRNSCFCSLVGAGPSDERGADVIACDLEGSLVMEPRTPAGEALLGAGVDVLTELGPAEAAEAFARSAVAHELPGQLERADVVDAAKGPRIAEIWDAVDFICLRCGVCDVLCPAVASGGTEAGARPKHWLARLGRMVEPTGDRPVCTGCGRCVTHCPAGIDLREVLREQAIAADFCDPP